MRAVIAAGDRITAKAAEEIIKKGGNAFDAACAALLASPLAEPALTSVGGGGFLSTFEEERGVEFYDFFVDVPPNRVENPDFFPIYVDFGSAVQEFHIGSGSIAIPGVIGGVYRLWMDKGSMPFIDIVSVAAKLAKEGFYLSKTQASLVKLLEPIFTATKESREIYAKSGSLIDEKTLFKNEEYGEFLLTFAKEGADIFYKGEIAESFERFSIENEGNIRKEDLEKYEVKKRDPIVFNFGKYKIFTNPPPSSGGILIAFTLKLLENRNLGKFGSISHLKHLIEAMKITADFRKDHVNEHLHSDHLKEILENEHFMKNFQKSYESRLNLWGNTTHLSIIDKDRNAVSVTTTNGEGSGYILPNTGIMLNNMLGEEDLNPHGFFKWPPYVRLPSMMSPTMVFENNEPKLILGSAGSNRIRSAIVNVILNNLIFNMDLQKSVDEGRVHFENEEVFIEPGFSKEVIEKIEKFFKVSIFKEKNLFFGGVNAVSGDFDAGSDKRRGAVTVKII